MKFKNIHPERQYAISCFKSVQNATFQSALRHRCDDAIAKAATPEVVSIVLAMKSIPPHWASLILRFHYKLLISSQAEQLADVIATDAGLSYETLYYCYKFLADAQIRQLIDGVAVDAEWSLATLQSHIILTDDQRQQLLYAAL